MMVATNTPNTEALANPIYNPDIDETSLKLFNVMNADYPPELIDQYRQVIVGLPTSNAFSGVLNNPRSCEISQVQTAIGEIQSSLTQQYQNIVTAGTVGSGYTGVGTFVPGQTAIGVVGQTNYVPGVSEVTTLNQWQLAMPQMTSDLNQISQTMGDFQDHTDRMIANFPSILGMIQTALGLATALGGLLDPCLGLNDFLGSLLGKGSELMKQINAAIAKIKGAINAALSAIQEAIAAVMNKVQSLIALVEREIMKLIKSLIDAARLGLAQLLSLLPKDPCFKAVMNTLGTGALLGTVEL